MSRLGRRRLMLEIPRGDRQRAREDILKAVNKRGVCIVRKYTMRHIGEAACIARRRHLVAKGTLITAGFGMDKR